MKFVLSLQDIIVRFMVKYDKLNKIFDFAYPGFNNQGTVNLFIDLYSIYHNLYSRSYTTTAKDNRDLTVGIIDLCAHYRTFFRYRGIHTKIFLISSYNIPKHNTDIIPEYNKTMQEKLKNSVIANLVNVNIPMLELLCPYLNDIHFIKTEHEASSVIYHIANNLEAENRSIVLSTDVYPMKLTTMVPNLTYIWPRKKNHEDASLMIPCKMHSAHKYNFWCVYLQKTGKLTQFEKYYDITTSVLDIVESYFECKDRNLTPSIVNRKKILDCIYNTIGYQDTVISLATFKNNLSDSLSFLSDDQMDIIEKRYRCMSLQIQNILYNDSIEKMSLSYQNLNDPQALQIINNEFFSDEPLDILRL